MSIYRQLERSHIYLAECFAARLPRLSLPVIQQIVAARAGASHPAAIDSRLQQKLKGIPCF